MFKKGMFVQFTNKFSDSQYDGIVKEVHDDMLVATDEYDNVFKVPFKFWNVIEIEPNRELAEYYK